MDTQSNPPKSRMSLIAILLLTAGLGCLCLPGNLLPTSPTAQSSLPAEPPAPADTQAPVPEASALNAEGPWLLMRTDEGVWAANPDGSGLRQLAEVDYWSGGVSSFLDAMQPGGDQVAFLSHEGPDRIPALNLLSLPGGEVTRITDLTTPETDPGEKSLESEAIRVVGEYAWSPDGTRLAFVGLLDGPSADIYLYTLPSGETTRVSQDEAENYDLAWSPDGETLVFFGAEAFGAGAGFETTSAWSARGDGTDVMRMYEPQGGAEELVGWLDDTTAVMNSWIFSCPYGNTRLRLFDVNTGQTEMLHEGCFTSAALNSAQGAVMFFDEAGLYLMTAGDREPTLVSEKPVSGIWAWEAGDALFGARFEDGSMATFARDHTEDLAPPDSKVYFLRMVADGQIWAWGSSDRNQKGVWISGPGMESGPLFLEGGLSPTWDPHDNLIFFDSAGQGLWIVFRATFETRYEDISVVGYLNGSTLGQPAWLGWQTP